MDVLEEFGSHAIRESLTRELVRVQRVDYPRAYGERGGLLDRVSHHALHAPQRIVVRQPRVELNVVEFTRRIEG